MSPGPRDWPHRHEPGRLAIAKAIPAGSRRARGQRSWLRAVLADPVIAELRADKRRSVLELARVLARHADWKTKTTWRPRALACAEIGSSRDPSRPLSVSAYKAARRILEERGLLGLVSQGWTSALGAGALDDHTALSAVFVLVIPARTARLLGAGGRRRVNHPLTRSRSDLVKPPHAREPAPLPRPGVSALGAVPQTRGEALGVAQAIRDQERLLRRLSPEHLRHLARPFFAAGWCGRDVLHAIDHDPRGRRYGFRAAVRSSGGWIRARLAAWLGPDEIPLPSRSQRLAEERRRVRAEQESRRAAWLEGDARRAPDQAAHAARAREMLARARSRASVRPAIPDCHIA